MSTRLYYDEWGNYVGGATTNPMMVGYLRNPLIAGLAPSVERINEQIASDPAIQWFSRKVRALFLCFVFFCLALICCITFALISCLPMWQRVCIHPSVVRLHMKRAKIACVGGGLLLFPKLIQIVTGFDLPPLTGLTFLVGLVLFPLAGLTMLVGLGQQILSRRYRYWSHGAGFGLFNLVNLAFSRPPSQTLTYIQDIGIVCLLYWVFGFETTLPDRTTGLIVATALCLLILPYTWFCQVKYANGNTIHFR